MSPDMSEHKWPMVLFDSSMLIGLLECRLDLKAEIERVLSTKFRPIVLSGTL
jgi:rRNA-processing protein FCF1